jgi:hypothetical protein
MISLAELDDCKTPEQLTALIQRDAEDAYWDNWDDLDDEDEPVIAPPQSQADRDVCAALTREALEYAAIGDLEEAKLRVRNRFHPKFSSAQECEALYKEAMSERIAR